MTQRPAGERPNILIIDDEPSIGLLISLMLKGQCDVEIAESLEDGLPLLAGGRYALILLDLRMPGVDGYELLEHVRRTVPTTPVAILSASDTPATHREVLRRGAVALIVKPFTRRELLTQLGEILHVPISDMV